MSLNQLQVPISDDDLRKLDEIQLQLVKSKGPVMECHDVFMQWVIDYMTGAIDELHEEWCGEEDVD